MNIRSLPGALLARAFCMLALVVGTTAAAAQTPEPLALPDVELGVGGSVQAIVPVPGGFVIAGQFNSVNGELRNNLALLNGDGEVVAGWNPGTDRVILSADWDGADGIFIGGAFSEAGGLPRAYVARLSLATGTVDPGWNPGTNGEVRALVHDGGGHVYLAGAFGSVAGVNRARVAKVDADSGVLDAWSISGGGPPAYAIAVDAQWVYLGRQNSLRRYARSNGVIDNAWNANPNNRVLALLPDGAGQLYVGGRFKSINGQPRQGIARVSAPLGSGAAVVSPAFNPGSDGVVGRFILSGGQVYIGGDFSIIGGQDLPRLARVSTVDGAADASWRPNPNREVFALAISPGGQIIAGGPFGSIGGEGRVGLARLDAVTAAVDPAFVAQATATGSVRALLRLADGSMIAGGVFDSARDLASDGPLLVRGNLIRIDGDGELDPAWAPQTDGQVGALALDGNQLVVGGTFLFAGLSPRARLARFDLATGTLLDWNPGADDEVRALAVTAGATVAGGIFTAIGGGARNFLGAVDADGMVLPLDAAIEGIQVDALRLDGAGGVWVGGEFSAVQGEPRQALARIDLDSGQLDAAADPDVRAGGDSGRVLALGMDGDGNLVVGGSFDSVAGSARANLARLDPQGNLSPWNPGTNGSVNALAVDPSGIVHLGGAFTSVSGQPRAALARLGPLGDLDANWQPSANLLVRAMTGDGEVVAVAGEFSAVSNIFRSGLALLPTMPAAELIHIEITGLAAASVVGEQVPVSVRVSSASATSVPVGSVLVEAGGASCVPSLSVGPDSALDGTCNVVPGSVGEYRVSASFSAGSTDFFDAATAAAHSVGVASTTLQIVAIEPAAPAVGQPVSVAVALAVDAPAAGSPGGSVTVSSDNDSCTIDLDLAENACELVFAATGSFAVNASYPGDGDFDASSDSAAVTVSGVPVEITITDVAPSPSVSGQAFTVSFLVEAANAMAPEGSVTVSAGDLSCGPLPLGAGDAGVGSCMLTASAAGLLQLSAAFSGSGIYDSAVSAPAEHAVERAATAISASSPSPTSAGEAFPVSASLAVVAPGSGAPLGPLLVSADSGEACSIDRALGESACSLQLTQAGVRSLTVSYAGDEDHLPSSTQIDHQVEAAATLSGFDGGAPNPSAPGQTVTFAFSVSPAAASGSVDVRDSDDSVVCSGSLDAAGAGTCSVAFAASALGAFDLHAVYLGDDNFLGSVSLPSPHEVALIATELSVSGPATSTAPGETVLLNWTLQTDPGRVPFGEPTGTVDVSDGSALVCTGIAVADGGCAFVASAEGGLSLTASYSGDAVHAGSTSNEVEHTVVRIATTLELGIDVPDVQDIRVGDTVSFTWEVAAARDDFGTLDGLVHVASGPDACSADVTAGSCQITLSVFGDGVTFQAEYEGSAVFAPSLDTLDIDILETPRQLSVDARVRKRVSHSLVLLAGGDWVRYEILVDNLGEDALAAADVLDVMPDELDIDSVSWTCEGFDGGQCEASSGSGDIAQTVTLTSGGSVRYMVTGLAPDMHPFGLFGNVVVVDAGSDDVAPDNNVDGAAYQRCPGNEQTDPEDGELRAHDCVFRDRFEDLPPR